MSFKFKDLIVDVVPETNIKFYTCYLGTACANPTYLCRYPTFRLCPLATCKGNTYVACQPGTHPPLTDCGGTIWGCGGTVIDVNPGDLVEDLAVLKRDLSAALEQIDAQEKVLRGGSGLRTRAEAEAVESRLQAALKEVQAEKANLK